MSPLGHIRERCGESYRFYVIDALGIRQPFQLGLNFLDKLCGRGLENRCKLKLTSAF